MKGIVYFIGNSKARVVKIGMSSREDPEERLSALQTGCPYDLEVMAVVNCGEFPPGKIERGFHDTFHEHLLRGEWFRYSGLLEDMVRFLSSGEIKTAVLTDLSRTHKSGRFTFAGIPDYLEWALASGRGGKVDKDRHIINLESALRRKDDRIMELEDAMCIIHRESGVFAE